MAVLIVTGFSMLAGRFAKSREKRRITATITGFLRWYKVNYESIVWYDPVISDPDGDPPGPCRVDFEQYSRYLDALRASGYLSEAYFAERERYFRKQDAEFREDSRTEGPPRGFDYDPVLLTREPAAIFDSIPGLRVLHTTLSEREAEVRVAVYQELTFRLSKEEGKWLIDAIDKYSRSGIVFGTERPNIKKC